MSHDTALRELAERLGVQSSYLTQDGAAHRSTSDETRVAILAAMGSDASSEARARMLLAGLRARDAERVAGPVRVVRERTLRATDSSGLVFHLPDSWGARVGEEVEYTLAIEGERAGDVNDAGVGPGPYPGSDANVDSFARVGADSFARAGAVRVGASGHIAIPVAARPLPPGSAFPPPRTPSSRPPPASSPPFPSPGYYDLRIELSLRGRSTEARQRLIVAPDSCVTPERPGYGIVANLYSVRGARSWGVGDLTDLADLARWAGASGAAFVGVNPLHALRTVGGEVSPYSPVSRLYRNPAYLDIEAIPEFAACPEARAMYSDSMRAELASIRSSERVEYDRRARLARPLLEALHRCFVERYGSGRESVLADPAAARAGRGGAAGRGRGDGDSSVVRSGSDAGERRGAYTAYLLREGRALDEFATFMAIDEYFVARGGASLTWRGWPSEYRSPDSPAVSRFAHAHEREVDFHRWLQFELDRQLTRAAAAGARAGLSLGLYQDLAVASAPYGSDVWARADIHAHGVEFGAPPDDYSATGQNWGLTPLDPHKLRADGYRFWTALVRSALRGSGAVRIDHALGLFRQFWIPAGMDGTRGAYVRFPTDDLMGILALESSRHHAVIVGEDLGTVPPEVPGTLREWGVLGTRVVLFERERDGAFRPAASYEPLSLATADTHDLPTLAGYWEGKDVALAARIGRLPDAAAERAALRSRHNDRRLLTDRLISDGALASGELPGAEVARAADGLEVADTEPSSALGSAARALPDSHELRDAVHRFLCSTPAVLVGISLDDLAGETEPVNVPGVTAEHFASWTRRMRTPLAELIARKSTLPPGGCGARRATEPSPD